MSLRFYSQMEATGYGMASVAYVRGLVKAGVPVEWVPLTQQGWDLAKLPPGAPIPLLDLAQDDESLADLPELLAATSRRIEADTVLAHCRPEYWSLGFEPGKRNIGFTAWEADLIPPHWKPLLDSADAICIPCELNREVFVKCGVRPPVSVIPHIRSEPRYVPARAEVADFRGRLGIPSEHRVFYSINTWDPRKDLPDLIKAYARAFTAGDAVTLVIKTSRRGYGPAPYYQMDETAQLAAAVIQVEEEALGRPLPSICLLPYELNGKGIELLHALGDCYVSLSHGEAWGLGAFEAACRGVPVIMTGWGGQTDFLGLDWRGSVACDLRLVPIFQPEQPTFWPPQRWAYPRLDAAIDAMRDVLVNTPLWLDDAHARADRLSHRFGEAEVTQQLLRVITS